ncbi:MAG TPA: FtsQ-type POTRA domain-containing protein [Terriglobales bacterium]|nr:FtsQ-type POTRA domain-containing protein [Terriglobales bacterium]
MARNDGYPTDSAPWRGKRGAGAGHSGAGTAYSDEEAERGGSRAAVEDDDFDPRLLDLEVEEESPFLRGQKRVPVRRGPLPRKAANRLRQGVIALACATVLAWGGYQLYSYGTHSWRFRMESSDDVQLAGLENVSKPQVMEVFAADLGRNIFFVPLAERRRQLEEIPWVESATVMRLLPHRISVKIRERTPVAFAQVGSRIQLIDAGGVLMELPARSQKKYSFPVLVGMGANEPLSTRAARMRIFTRVMRELDSEGARYSQDISEMDLSDPADVRVTVPDDDGAVFVHLGDANFLERFKIYKAHVQQWRAQFQKLSSVDLRYERQVIVNPDAGAQRQAIKIAADGKAPPPKGKR